MRERVFAVSRGGDGVVCLLNRYKKSHDGISWLWGCYVFFWGGRRGLAEV